MPEKTKILLVEDDPDILFSTARTLRSAGYEVLEASSAKDCWETIRVDRPDLLLLDVVLPDADGRELCSQLKANQNFDGIFVVLLSGTKISSNDQVEGLDLGADGYIARPIANKELLARIQAMDRIRRVELDLRLARDELEQRVQERTAELVKVNERLLQEVDERKRAEEELSKALSEVKRLQKQQEAENVYLREEIKLEHNFEEIIGQSDALKDVLLKLEQVAPTDTTVLILGETGTGKELVARALHNASMRNKRPMLKVNCAALPANLIESELFGHERGAFTGALTKQVGRFEVADGATLFLDEIGDLPLEVQAKLLRVLEHGEFERLGSHRTLTVDVRIIAATNRKLEEEVENDRFRRDLWFRLNVFPIAIPPLRKRAKDIPLLANHFIAKQCKRLGRKTYKVPKKTIASFVTYSWPGNVRELENVIERAFIASRDPIPPLTDLFKLSGFHTAESAQERTLADIERDHILRVLEECYWRIEGDNGAAKILGLNPNTLRGRMRKLGISRPKKSPNNHHI
jgi:DNA-binding NtrC family response regulator